MSSGSRLPRGWVWAAVLLVNGGCRGCSAPGRQSDAAATPAASSPLLPRVRVAALSPPRFLDSENSRGLGLPAGCRIDPPVRHAALQAEKLRFVAVPGVLDSLAMAVAGQGPAPARRGLVDLDRHERTDLPWDALDAPPALARSARGWVAALSRPAAPPLSRAVLWRQWTSPESLLEGDRLQVADLACAGDRCALLASLARRAEAPGATLLLGRADAPAREWKRIDVQAAPGSAVGPYSFAGFDPASAEGRVALAAPGSVELWRIGRGRAQRESRIATPFGLYAVAPAATAAAIAPGRNPRAPCTEDRFPLLVARGGAPPDTVVLQAPPTGVIAAGIGRGAIVAWMSRATCRSKTLLVSALLLDAQGRPRGGPMVVEEASGFALATHGESLSLWLATDTGLDWVRGSCSP